MLKRATQASPDFDPVPTLLHHLQTGDDVIRTDAVRALAVQAPGDERVRLALIGALLDEDPDVRSDAMDALPQFAQPEDADRIRENLIGDPVREVKLAAIELLADLDDKASVPLLRRLALSRCEDEVAWEDEIGLWDEWLEIQTAAIRALGRLGAKEAIEDILCARDDEYGQNLDLPICEALSGMGEAGMVWLLAMAQTEGGLPRKRALEAMAKLDADALRPHLDFLLGDDNAEVRRLALPLLAADDDRAGYLALKDADPALRAAALAHAAPARPELAVSALSDPEPPVQAAALDHLQLPLSPELAEVLSANMQAWLLTDHGVLASAVARNWVRLIDGATPEPLEMLLRNGDQPLDARIAAIEALDALQDEGATERLVDLLTNPAQQVRMVALTCLVARADKGDDIALDALEAAATNSLIAPEPAAVPAPLPDGDEVPRLRIDAEGQITTTSEEAGPAPMSTLEAIQINRLAKPESTEGGKDATGPDDSKGNKGNKGKRRRSVEGPAEIGEDLARVSLGLISTLVSDRIGVVIRTMTEVGQDTLRTAAYQALAARIDAGLANEADLPRLRTGLMDRLERVRGLCARLAVAYPALHPALAQRMDDPDALVRAQVVAVLEDPEALGAALGDPDARVRAAALTRLAADLDASTDKDAAAALLKPLLSAEAIETLALALTLSPMLRAEALARLAEEALPKRRQHVLLQAFAGGMAGQS
ncbi:HEAT repeat domain-containing protein [Aliiroseovarius sp.]|uniref:HEAT repeat domain-containing protein n=1 Tax=Aliiroseovarius sp. TaxID=1872442 RepID=UPI00262C2D69|nr:HEAT repeat domain-containing protein [Aliiroseovarius sp.]